MCHWWNCWYRVYWNLSYPFSIEKVIFLKSNPFRFEETVILVNKKNPEQIYVNVLDRAVPSKHML
jgi:hypothetical protein